MDLSGLKKILTYRFTFMLVPHGAGTPRQLSIHLSVIVLALITWSTITFWGSYLSAQHIDYWRAQVSNQVLKMKVQYLVAQLDQSRGYLDDVKTVEGELRNLLEHKNAAAIIRNDRPAKSEAASGGPSVPDQIDLHKDLDAMDPDFSWQRLFDKVGSMRTEASARLTSYDELTGYIDMRRQLFRATPRGWPCPGRLTSHFGRRNSPFSGASEYHPGLDIAGPSNTQIRATADGVVRIAGWRSGYGNLVVVQHEFGYHTRYAHNSKFLVRPGDRVKRGQPIAVIGDTGKSSGIHCHYEVWRFSQRQNPYAFLKDDPADVGVLTRAPKTPTQTALKQS